MDMWKLPPSLRRYLISTTSSSLRFQRCIATETYRPHDFAPRDEAVIPSRAASPPPTVLSPLNSYKISTPPNAAQLKYATSFFRASPPQLLFSAAYFRSFPRSYFPEVAFLGRSNVGKSSLLNALFGRTKIKDAHVSKQPGRTKTMNAFGVAGGAPIGTAPKNDDGSNAWKRFPLGSLVVVDMPGYGKGSREDWGQEVMKYLEQRQQLRRVFVLVDAQHGLTARDIAILTHLRRQAISHQVILSKVDKLLYSGPKAPSPEKLHTKAREIRDLCRDIRRQLDAETGDARQSTGDILCCSAEKTLDKTSHEKLGIEEVRWAALSACGLECDEMGMKRKRSLDGLHIVD